MDVSKHTDGQQMNKSEPHWGISYLDVVPYEQCIANFLRLAEGNDTKAKPTKTTLGID